MCHTGETLFKCMLCKKAFGQSALLKHHKLNHTGEKPFKSAFCEKDFNESFNLKTHMIKNIYFLNMVWDKYNQIYHTTI